MKKLPTSSQPEPAKTRIYGSAPVRPLAGASNQPEVLPHTRVHGVRKTPQIRVRLKTDKDKREFLIPFDEFNPAIHSRVD